MGDGFAVINPAQQPSSIWFKSDISDEEAKKREVLGYDTKLNPLFIVEHIQKLPLLESPPRAFVEIRRSNRIGVQAFLSGDILNKYILVHPGLPWVEI
jgi:hypothetical protein